MNSLKSCNNEKNSKILNIIIIAKKYRRKDDLL